MQRLEGEASLTAPCASERSLPTGDRQSIASGLARNTAGDLAGSLGRKWERLTEITGGWSRPETRDSAAFRVIGRQ